MKAAKLFIILFISLLVLACMAKDPVHTASNSDEDYGIGGTGIVGTVTGFGSIFVNGVEVEISAQTALSVNGQMVDDHRFQIGETVEVLAQDDADFTQARRLNIRHEIIGPVSAWDQETGVMQILGQRIQLTDDAFSWSIGQVLAISGYRDQRGVIQATRVDNQEGKKLLLRGNARDVEKQLRVAGIEIMDSSRLSQFNGSVQIRGRLDHQRLDIQRIDRQTLLPYQRVNQWKIQGYAASYGERWPELERLGKSELKPVQFELKINRDGQVSVNLLDTSRLRTGAPQYRGSESKGSGSIRSMGSGAGGRGRP